MADLSDASCVRERDNIAGPLVQFPDERDSLRAVNNADTEQVGQTIVEPDGNEWTGMLSVMQRGNLPALFEVCPPGRL